MCVKRETKVSFLLKILHKFAGVLLDIVMHSGGVCMHHGVKSLLLYTIITIII